MVSLSERERARFIDGRAGTAFAVQAAAGLLGERSDRAEIIRLLKRLHGEGLIGEPGVPVYYGGLILVRGRRAAETANGA